MPRNSVISLGCKRIAAFSASQIPPLQPSEVFMQMDNNMKSNFY